MCLAFNCKCCIKKKNWKVGQTTTTTTTTTIIMFVFFGRSDQVKIKDSKLKRWPVFLIMVRLPDVTSWFHLKRASSTTNELGGWYMMRDRGRWVARRTQVSLSFYKKKFIFYFLLFLPGGITTTTNDGTMVMMEVGNLPV